MTPETYHVCSRSILIFLCLLTSTPKYGFFYVDERGAISIDDFEEAFIDRKWCTPLLINKSRTLSISRSPVGVEEPPFDLLSSPISREFLAEYYSLVLWLPSCSASFSKYARGSVNIVSLPEGECLATLEPDELERHWALKSKYIHVDDAVVSFPDGGIRYVLKLIINNQALLSFMTESPLVFGSP